MSPRLGEGTASGRTPVHVARRRPSTVLWRVYAALGMALLAVLAHAIWGASEGQARRAEARARVAALGLTDLALFGEARYTRHPSQADPHSAFQDAPGSIEHFPAGSWIGPPRHWPAAGLRDSPPETGWGAGHSAPPAATGDRSRLP